MDEILVSGHRNPDTDSVCSAVAYAYLGNELSKTVRYKPIRCGHLQRQTSYIFEKLGATPPDFVKNVHPSVADAMTRKVEVLDADAPLLDALHGLDAFHMHTTPVVSEGMRYEGVVSVLETARLFLGSGGSSRTKVFFRSSNVERALGGHFLHRGANDDFSASLVIGAMAPQAFRRRLSALPPSQTMLVMGNRPELLENVVSAGIAALVLTGVSNVSEIAADFANYKGWVFISPHDTLESVRRLLLSIPVRHLMSQDVPTLSPEDAIAHAKELFKDSTQRGLPVLRDGVLEGVLTRADMLKDPRKRLVLVDHNELEQAVEGAETAEIVEIIDHHRLGAPRTKLPIDVYVRPAGSSCTLVAELFKFRGVVPPPQIAGLLLAGILCDTLSLRSPTSSAADRAAVEELSRLSGIEWEPFANEIMNSTDPLASRPPEEIVLSDFKTYREFDVAFGIGQVETVDLDEVPELAGKLRAALSELGRGKGLDWSLLLVTDIVHCESVLISSGLPDVEGSLKYARDERGFFALPGVLSRKKQLLPEVLRILESRKEKNSCSSHGR